MSLNDLSTAPITDAVDFADLPGQMGGVAPMFQPGPYRFRLSKLGPDNFDKITDEKWGERVKVKFDQNAPLVVVQATDPQMIGDPFTTQLTNVPRRRGKGEDAPVASDLDYLLKALGVTERPKTPRATADALIVASNQAKEFGADIEASWNCSAKKDAQWYDSATQQMAGGTGPDGQPLKGCGKRMYQKDVAKVDGKFPERVVCPACGATVRGFANLTRFRE